MNSTSGPIIKLEEVALEFDGFNLKNINLELYHGEVHVIVGENGSGKSSLMRILGGWYNPDSGTIYYDGKILNSRDINQANKAGIYYINQDVQFFDNLTVGENIFFNKFPKLWGISSFLNSDKMHADCERLFWELGIPLDTTQIMRNLGYAERQVLAAIRAYILDAKVIIFDEPSSALAEFERNLLFKIVSRLKERGVSIFYISHRMDEILQIGDRVSVLQAGELTSTSRCDSITRDGLIKMMTGSVHRNRYPRLRLQNGTKKKIMSVSNLSLEPILKDVSFDLFEGEILGITGLMGSGRSLLANCLFGVVNPKSGKIIIADSEVQINHPIDAMNKGISLIPEDRLINALFPKHNLVRNMTSATLRRFRQNYILDENYMGELSQEYVHELSILPGHSNDILENYSGGNQQKVMIARWLMNRSKIYIMDEPTRGIDAASRVDIYNAMNDIVTKSSSIILISSEIEEILGMCDRILVLSAGKITAEMPQEEASKEKILEFST